MKLRLAVAIGLIMLCVGMAIFSLFRLDASAREISWAIEIAMHAAIEESPGWEAATDEVIRLLERDKGFMHILLPHVNLNELEWAIGSLPEYFRQSDKALYVEMCVRGLQCLNTIREMERPNLGNIF